MEIKDFITSLKEMNFSLAVENEKLLLQGDKKKVSAADKEAIKSNSFVLNYIRENKQEIIKYLAEYSEQKPKNIAAIYRLSSLQQGMLFHGLYDEYAGTYIDQFGCDLVNVKQDIFRQAWSHVLNAHTILRSAFYYDKFSIPVQCVYTDVNIPVTILDYRGLNETAQLQALKGFENEDRVKGFDFKNPPLIRLALIQIKDDRCRMLCTWHHILFDGWSLPVLMEEFLNTYELMATGQQLPVREEDRYEDYIRYIEKSNKEQEENYWRNYMDGVTQSTLLPFIKSSADRTKGVGESRSVYLQLTDDFTSAIQNFAQQYHITANTIMQGVWSYLLKQYTGSDDIVFGTIASGRPDDLSNVERRVGMYINTLPFHGRIDSNKTITAWLQEIQVAQVASRQYQHTPFSSIQGWTGVAGDLFDSILVYQNYPFSKIISAPSWQLQVENSFINQKNNLPLTITVTTHGQLRIEFRYNTDLLEDTDVNKMLGHFEAVLHQVIENPAAQISDVILLTAAEKHQILTDFNNSKVAYRADSNLIKIFEEQVEKSPKDIALVFEGQQLTYEALNAKANQLARCLQAMGVKKETPVPMCLERGMNMMVGMLAILKAGGAYVPIDTDFPQERKQFMLEDTGSNILLTSKATLPSLYFNPNTEIIAIDGDWSKTNAYSADNLQDVIQPDQLAYIIYTSGSTGRPKGVMIEHRNLLDYVAGLEQKIQVSQSKTFALVSTIATDLGNTVIFASLLTGGALHIFSKESVSDAEFLQRYFSKHKIDCLKIVPSHWKALCTDEQLLMPAKLLVFGGEALQSVTIDRIRESHTGCVVVNHYGPTETSIGKLLHVVDMQSSYGYTIPIGRPFSNTQVYILSNDLKPCPVGVPGQLFIAGDGVARGYYNNEHLTLEKFIVNPFNTGSRMYATGDLVKYLPDGNIEFIGRVDDQVKIRGYRIELGEIESRLQQNEQVRQAVVLAKGDKQENKRLVAYIVTEDSYDRERLIAALKMQLPDYMIPGIILELESLPLTANGKVDRKALPDPDSSEGLRSQYIAPRNDTEAKLATIWQEILEVDLISVHSDFFELGGHSLLAVRLISAIRKAFTVEMPIGFIFDYPTVAQLAEQLAANATTDVLPTITKAAPLPQRIPLSFSQERLWFIDQLDGSRQYHVPAVIKLSGKLNKDALAFALKSTVDRHEVLRTVYREEDGQPYQLVNTAGEWSLEILDRTGSTRNETVIQEEIQQLIDAPFDLAKDYMLRAALICLEENEHVLVVTLHHIASDGWSKSVLVNDFTAFYTAHEEGGKAALPVLPVQYADFAIWQRANLSGEVLDAKISYWREELHGVSPLQLPTDFQRPAIQTTKGAIASFNIDKGLSAQIDALAHQHGSTLFMTLLAAFKVLLYRFSGQQDICVGTPIAGRQQQEVEKLIGFFVNTLALRTEVNGTAPFTDLLLQVRKGTLEAYQHQELPFEKIVETIVKDRDLGRSPIFQVMFVLRNTPEVPELIMKEVSLSRGLNDHTTAIFDITFFITESISGLQGAVEYNTDLFIESTIQRMIGGFAELLRAIVVNPQQKVGLLPILTAKDEEQLLKKFNDTGSAYPKQNNIISLFEEQVVKTPAAVAVVFEGGQMSYGQLNEKANQLAHYLQANGVRAGSLVPVSIERGFEMIVGVLAVLKAGGVYVPVDPEYPAERISYMLEDTGAAVIISSKESSKNLPATPGARIIEADGMDAVAISRQPVINLSIDLEEDHLVYIIYTSGSTGKPKGVRMGGAGMVNLLNWQDKQFSNKQRRVLQFASLNFDVSFQEIFSTLCYGSSLYLVSGERRRDMGELLKDITRYQLTHLFVPYIVLKILVESAQTSSYEDIQLEEIIVAGEQLKLTDDIQSFLHQTGVRIINQYGPTEAHVVSSYTVDSSGSIPLLPPIGKPIDNVQLYILGEMGNPVPVGVAGELFIGGVQVAQGYLNLPDLTTEKFMADPFTEKDGARLYKTGDLARWLPDGNIEYLGRMDDQVKIRGYRVELGEIESVLQECPLVRQAAVLAKDDAGGGKRLVAYVVAEGDFDKPGIIYYLKDQLPEYMVPALFVQLDQLPVTRNGKIDRKALPDADASDLQLKEFIAPGNETENELAGIWKELLKISKVGINDNFFELGGHSLLASRAVSAIRKRMNVELAIKDLFIHQDIATLSALILSKSNKPSLPAIRAAVPRPAQVPLSFSQERLWFIDQLEGSVQYNLPIILHLKGALIIAALSNALKEIVSRHEVLRTVFREAQGMVTQSVQKTDAWELMLVDGDEFLGDEQQLKKYTFNFIRQPFDLSKDYMLRAALVRLNEHEHVLIVAMHHIAADAWSMGVLVKEVAELYSAFAEERIANLPSLELQYADYALWQRNYLRPELLDHKLEYWKQKLDGAIALQLPTDHPRPATGSTHGAAANFTIPKDLANALHELSRREGATLFMTLLSAFKILLHRYSGQNDICVGTSIANRPQQEVEALVGFFVNTLTLRSELDGQQKFNELLQQVKATTLGAYEHQDVPFEKIVEAVVKERDPSRSPLFQVMLVLLNTPEVEALRLGEVELTRRGFEGQASKFDITFFVTGRPEGLQCSVAYSADLYDSDTIERMILHYQSLLHAVVKTPEEKISRLPLLSEPEQQVIATFGKAAVSYPIDKSVVELFEEQAAKNPQTTVLVFEGQSLSYAQLNGRANQVAHALIKSGIQPGMLVGLYVERSLEMMTGLLGIMKAGAAYVPIDTEFPQERIDYMLADAQARVIVSTSTSSTNLELAPGVSLVETDNCNQQSTENITTKPSATGTAYVIYTSGSTGKPKGVMITHRNLVDYYYGLNKYTGLDRCRSFALVSTIATDLGNTVIYGALLSGGTLHLFTKETVSNIEAIHAYFEEHPIDCLKIVPSHWKALSSQGAGPLLPKKALIFGGEALPADMTREITATGSSCTIINHYGPTETTIGKLLHVVQPANEYQGTIPIGKPFSNTQVYVLSKELQPCPIGVAGQLYIAGDGLAKGYYNKEALTKEKFIPNPHATSNGQPQLMYGTGDLVKYLPDGNIAFIGRVDDQVKIRGYRIELGEIESALQQLASVRQAVVLAKEDAQGNKRLVGYIVAEEKEEPFDKEEILTQLRAKLPEYMVPAVVVELEALPLTANGKVDRKALPDPGAADQSQQYTAPRNKTEAQLAAIWQEVLEVDEVSVHADFFELGGHSLLAVRLISAIRKAFSVEMPIGDIFDYPTVAQLAEQVSRQEQTGAAVLPTIQPVTPRPERIPLSFSQERLWFIDRLEGSVQYHVPYVLRLTGQLSRKALADTLHEIVTRHEVLRTIFLEDNGQAYQQVKNHDNWELAIGDAAAFSADETGLQQYIQQLVLTPFDLATDYMFRAHLVEVAPNDHVLVITLHHIASDGWSTSILVKEVVALYKSFDDGVAPSLPALKIQYADFAIWQRSFLKGETLDKKITYWKEKLDDIAPLQLPTDFPRRSVQSTAGGKIGFYVNKDVSAALQQISQQNGATIFMTLLSAFNVLLYRYSGQKDITVGSPIAGRQQQELENLIGFFVNMLTLRSDLDGNMSFTDLLKQVRNTTMEAYANQEVPFEKVVDAVVKERAMNRNPLFQVMFVLRNTPEIPQLRIGDIEFAPEGHEHTTALFDLTLFITETPDGLRGTMEYSKDLYKPATIEAMIAHFCKLLENIVEQPQQQIGVIKMLSAAEETKFLTEFNDTSADYPNDKSIVALFEEQAEKNAGRIAISFEQESITYKILNERSNQLAHYLVEQGVQPGALVPLCIGRGIDMLVGLLGILKAGAAFIPIDPEYPSDRIHYMLSDASAKLVVSSSEARSKFPGIPDIQVIELSGAAVYIKQQSTENISINVSPGQLAYVIYTSGSTGNPKGVMIQHGSVVNLLTSIINDVDFKVDSSFLSVTTFSFDICYLEFFVPLISGGKLIIVSRDTAMDGYRLAESLATFAPTHMQGTPSTWRILLDSEWKNKESIKILIGGEAVREDIKEQLTSLGDVYNLYGPTETTIWSAIKQLKSGEKVLIGRPIANTSIYLINEQLQLCLPGVAGEICIGGDGLARGYLNRPDLTIEKFITDPFSTIKGARLYRTGDMGRWLPDGNIEYLGRMDEQVKIRGYRIELGEIETRLLQSEFVRQGVVLAKENTDGSKQLVCYYVPETAALKAKEKELYQSQVATWKEVYEREYTLPAAERIDEEFDINIWKDSFTGQAIPESHMRQWLQDIVAIILEGEPSNVLEIGSGTGLVFYQLAGKIKKYIGTDFSSASISQITNHISKGGRNYGETALFVAAAHEVKLNEDENIDTIVLNSVVQYFPGEDYMTEVIGNSISLLKGLGRIVIGDVRDNRLLEIFKVRLDLQKLSHSVGVQELMWLAGQEVLKEEELCFDPQYFYRLAEVYPAITQVEIKWKQADYLNELSKYRYNVVLHIGTGKPLLQPNWIQWNNDAAKSITDQLQQRAEIIAIKDAPNHRLPEEKMIDEQLVNKTASTVGDLAFAASVNDEELQAIGKMLADADRLGYHSTLLLDEDPYKMNVVLERHRSHKWIKSVYGEQVATNNNLLTNIPLFSDIGSLMQKDIRHSLHQSLPDYMVPSEFFAIAKLPLTNNGKIDRRFLSSREDKGAVNTLNYQAPRTELEHKLVNIWLQLLGVQSVGVNDDFFELGGHSLLAMRVIAAIRRELELEVAIRELFAHPTIASLATYLQSQHKGLLLPPITKQERPPLIPLSFSQERLWFIDKLEGTVQYHIPAVLRLKGTLNKSALINAFQTIINRHEVLRTAIKETGGQLFQHIKEKHGWQLIEVDGIDLKKNAESLQHKIEQLTNEPFDLSADHMLKAVLIALEKDEHVLVVTMHHIASDGWSIGIIMREVTELYNAFVGGRTARVAALPIQYADYAIWQRTFLQGNVLDKKLAYWKEKLSGVSALQLPTDYNRPPVQSTKGAVANFSIEGDLVSQLQTMGQEQGATLFMTLLTAFNVLLHRYSGQQDICVGSPIANRTQQEIEDLVGFFVNTIAFRSEVNGSSSYIDLLHQVRSTTMEAYEHQEAPFEKVVEAVVKQRDMSRSPLFQVMFVLQNTPEVEELRLGDVQLSGENYTRASSKYDITLTIKPTNRGLHGSIEYCTDLYTAATIGRMISHFRELLSSIVAMPSQQIGLLPILGHEEEDQLLKAFNNTAVEYPANQTLLYLFEEQAAKTPAAVALIVDEEQLSYQALNESANQLAHYLVSKGVAKDTLVPVFIERGTAMLTAILAILKAGAAYVPIDPEYPAERISYMLEDTRAAVIVTSRLSSVKLPKQEGVELIEVDGDAEQIGKQSNKNLGLPITGEQLAYMIYTSGSTGKPKGVLITHGNVYSFLNWCKEEFANDVFEIVYATTSMCFDLSIFEFFYPLITGRRLRVLENGLFIGKYLGTDRQVLTNTVPSIVENLIREGTDLSNITVMNMAGEPIPLYVQQNVDTKRIAVRNLYGPTEDTTYSTVYRLQPGKPVLIGKPISNTTIHIVNAQFALVPIGVAGEICISGAGLAKGYLNKEDLTKERFTANPFRAGERMYRTGDLGRWLPDGKIEYLGRLDDQVKVRGYRIELGEIETVLQQTGLVSQSVVMARADKSGQKQLIGYVVSKEGAAFEREQVLTALRNKLPEYMVPAIWVELEMLPLTPNGKIDRKALPEVDGTALPATAYIAPRNATEEALVEIWQQLLGVQQVGVNDNFFELGGHSLMVNRLVYMIKKRFNLSIPIPVLFRFSTINDLANYIDWETNPTEEQDTSSFEVIKI